MSYGGRRLSKAARAELEMELGYTTGKGQAGRSKHEGVVSIDSKSGRRVPTGRVPDRYGCIGDGNPPNSRLTKLLAGKLDVSELLDEELAAGIPVCDDGKFSIRAAAQSAALPKSLQAKMQKELTRRCKVLLQGGALSAIQALIGMVSDPATEDAARINASKFLIERVFGKTPETVVHTQDKPWQTIVGTINLQGGSREESRARRRAAQEEVIDAEFDEMDAE